MSLVEQQVVCCSSRHLLFVCLWFAASIFLQGCFVGKGCPEMLPIKSGKVKMVCEKGSDKCHAEKIECDDGYGKTLLPKDEGFRMEYMIDKTHNCVLSFTSAPPYCQLCLDNDNIRVDNGFVKIAKGAKFGSITTDPGVATVTCENGKPGGALVSFGHFIHMPSNDSVCVTHLSSEACTNGIKLPAGAGGDAGEVESSSGNADEVSSGSDKADEVEVSSKVAEPLLTVHEGTTAGGSSSFVSISARPQAVLNANSHAFAAGSGATHYLKGTRIVAESKLHNLKK